MSGSLEVTGQTFSPRAAAETIDATFERITEPGELQVRGRYKGKLAEHGACSLGLEVEGLEGPDERVAALVESSLRWAPVLRESGAEDLTLNLALYPSRPKGIGACFGIDAPALLALGEAGIDVRVDAYEDSGDG